MMAGVFQKMAVIVLMLLALLPRGECTHMLSNDIGANITIVDVMLARDKGGGPKDAPSSFWTPNIVRTQNSIVVLALAKPMFHNYMVSSRDGGKSWVRDCLIFCY